MSELHESIRIGVPFQRIPALVRAYLGTQRHDRGDAIVSLRLIVAGAAVQRDVRLRIVETRRDAGCEIVKIAWKPAEDGPYPEFRGTLRAEHVENTKCRLDLDGGYEPPGGIAGVAFDAIAGNGIARLAARDLLQRFKDTFERAHVWEAGRVTSLDSTVG